MKDKTVISKDVALTEIETLINKFVKKPVSFDKIEETYPDILDAIMCGYLSFNEDGVPVYKLKEPVKTDKGNEALTVINFKTRVKPTAMADIGSGLDMRKDSLKFPLKIIAYITDQPYLMIDNYSRYDYDVIDQVCSVFS